MFDLTTRRSSTDGARFCANVGVCARLASAALCVSCGARSGLREPFAPTPDGAMDTVQWDIATEVDAPRRDAAMPRGLVHVAHGVQHACAWYADGPAFCWGRNDRGQVGDASLAVQPSPVRVPNFNSVTRMCVGGAGSNSGHTCAIDGYMILWCWGRNDDGQLGDRTRTSHAQPIRAHLMARATDVACGVAHTCARSDDGSVWCWGSNRSASLGVGLLSDALSPVQLPLLTRAAAVTSGHYHACALSEEGRVWCWGPNSYGEVGNGAMTAALRAVEVSGLDRVVQISGGGWHTCVRRDDGSVWCWGSSEYGQAGNRIRANPRPVRVALTNAAVEISAGSVETCARLADGQVLCWGSNAVGQLADGTTVSRSTPAPSLLREVRELADHGGCAVDSLQRTFCWGDNREGQVGDGSFMMRTTPVEVRIPWP